MRVREARLEDATAIARVHVASWKAAYRGILPDGYLDSLEPEGRVPMWRETLGSVDSRRCHVVAETDDGALFGFASGGPARVDIRLPQTGSSINGAPPLFDGELYAIYLLPEHWGKGAGRRLAQVVAQRLAQAGINSMLVWVLEQNPARAFYEKLGGVLVGRAPITIANLSLIEVAFGWLDIQDLSEDSLQPPNDS